MIYSALNDVAGDFDALPDTLSSDNAQERVDAIRTGLDRTAAALAAQPAAEASERDELSRLYRGFLAASRVLTAVYEKRLEAQGA